MSRDTTNARQSLPMTLDDVIVPDQDIFDPIETPEDSRCSAKSHGILFVYNGVHFFSGESVLSGTEFVEDATVNNFQFMLRESKQALKCAEEVRNTGGERVESKGLPFPLDSASYMGGFKLHCDRSNKMQFTVDKQIVLKFRLNTGGFYNVYGKGINERYGTFDLVGTFTFSFGDPNNGYINLFRTYLSGTQGYRPNGSNVSCLDRRRRTLSVSNRDKRNSKRSHCSISTQAVPLSGASPLRRSKRRKVKSQLNGDCDPETNLMTIMNVCNEIFQKVCTKDQSKGAYFAIPGGQIALNTLSYPNIITIPMDLGTIQLKINSKEITSSFEFSRLVRLVFENAMKFNVSTDHEVHKIAQTLLTFFNKEFETVERLLQEVGLTNATKNWNELYTATVRRRKEEDFNQFKKNLVVCTAPSPSYDSCWDSFIEEWADDTAAHLDYDFENMNIDEYIRGSWRRLSS